MKSYPAYYGYFFQIERNVEYVGKKRDGVSFSPKDISAAASFLEV